MFTGLVQDVGKVQKINSNDKGATLWIETQLNLKEWEIGESIAVNGACLTVTQIKEHSFSVDCAPETLRCTNFGKAIHGTKLHLERALRMGDKLGGHLVSGHVDTVGEVKQVSQDGNSTVIAVRSPEHLLKYMIPKGSITMDGVSLTIQTLQEDGFSCWIIPHTLEKTHFAEYTIGTKVHLEVDWMGKYIERLLSPWKEQSSTLDTHFLQKHGFLT